MTLPPKPSLAHRLRKTKAAFLAAFLTLLGILLVMFNGWFASFELGTWEWLHAIPVGELGGILLGAGMLGTLFEYSFRKDQEEATAEQFRAIIKEQAPAMRDAVVEGFAIHPEDLKRVANPDLLDNIASNVMALRLGDEQFAHEIYRDIRDQAIRSPERWYDAEVRIRLSTAVERSTKGAPLFDVTVEWEYTTVPSSKIRRFMCVSDRSEYNEVRDDAPATQAWFMTPRPGLDARSEESYKLLEFSVDGELLNINHHARKSGQTYSVNVGDYFTAGVPVRIRQVFRTRTPASGHKMYVELPQPARGFSASLDYTNTDIALISVTDSVAGPRALRLFKTPPGGTGKEIGVAGDSWYLAKTGFVFSWTLKRDQNCPRDTEVREAA